MDLIERAAKKQQKSKKGVSLVERAAENAGKNPFASASVGGIGVPGSKKSRDPSSMNPVSGEPSKPTEDEPKKPAFGGIGSSRQYLPERVAKPKLDSQEAEVEVEAPKKSLAIGARGHNTDKTGDGQKTTGRSSKTEEVDLIGLREGGYITPDMPPNLMAEEFRIIKRSLLLNAFSKGTQKSRHSNIVLVTSSNPGEGKTFCAINLALSIATEQDTTVLLVDADFSKPEILNRLGVSGGRGLMDVVADNELGIGDCLIRTNIPNLVMLPAGRQHNLTTELLASDRMEAIVEELANRYPDRLVIFDSPPVLASSAASVMALYMGQTVFVIHAEETTEPQIKESLNMISACDNISLLLNQTRYSGGNKKFASYYGYGGR